MYLKAASLLILLPFLCIALTAQEGRKRRYDRIHGLYHKPTLEEGRKYAASPMTDTRTSAIRRNTVRSLKQGTIISVTRNEAGNAEQTALPFEVKRKHDGTLEQAIRTEKGTYYRPNRSSNREKRSGTWEGRRGFECGDDIYIPTRWVCDGETDCPKYVWWWGDTSYADEENCFLCDDIAVDSDMICDGKTDCKNGWDEDVCFQCGDGYAIDSRLVCDGNTDCTNGLDEADCFDCGDRGSNGGDGIISYRYVCDGGELCADGSDEDCFDCRDGNSIHYSRVCDMTIHCTNGQDEDDCFACENDVVIPFRRVCNGDIDCINGLDENNCFDCGRGKIIRTGQVCDGVTNCKNGLDEKDCQFINHRDNGTEEGCLNATCPNEDHYFQCNSDHWIFQAYRCDGIPDCEDESDEQNCYVMPCPEDHYICPDGRCKGRMYFCEYVYNEYSNFIDRSDHYCPRAGSVTYKCDNYTCFDTVNTFQCTSGDCIKASRRCNDDHDCSDGSDEFACENHICSPGDFQCDSGQCIDSLSLCLPGHRCPDNSDKEECKDDGGVSGCVWGVIQCASGECIHREDWCDHTPDCRDGSDETSCENYTCGIFFFRCNSGQCIDSKKQCNNQEDCDDGSDEVNCELKCPLEHLRCDTDNCYPIHTRCDGHQNCLDNSDENNCVNGTLCDVPRYFPCRIKSSQCVPHAYSCDGIVDCNDTTDEWNCKDPTCSNKAYFNCSNGRCVHLKYICEAGYLHTDFIPCTDEPGNDTCTSHKCQRKKESFHCNNGYCISVDKRCNSRVDCPDGSDEDDCESICDRQSFNCSNGLCVARPAVCDGIVDCSDGGDERKCFFQCTSSQYTCESGHCIPMAALCNGYFEVIDILDNIWASGVIREKNTCPVFHDDEKYCPFIKCPIDYQRKPTGGCEEITDRTNTNCTISDTSAADCTDKCRNGLYYIQCCDCSCVHRVSICDGIQDCPNGADERNCGRVDCRPDQFYCGNITCFPIELRCDGYSHCPHYHDEQKCELKETAITQHSITINTPQMAVMQTDDQQTCFDPSICFTAAQICKSSGQCPMEVDNKDCFLLCGPPCVCQHSGQMFCRQKVGNNNPSVNDDSKMLWPFNNSNHINVGNPLFFTFETVSVISITNASLQQVPTRLLTCAFNIQHLNLSHNAITHISVGDFGRLYLLVLLDLSNNPITSVEDFSFKGIRVLDLRLVDTEISDFGIDLFSGMAIDRKLTTDDYRFCCVRPPHLPEHNCYPRADQFSSCNDLLKHTVLSTLVWIVGFVTLFGNSIVILLMITVEKESLTKNHGVMIINLAVADALMGVYLLSIGSVDAMYRDIYITKEYEWRNSVWCSLFGVLCMISNEASVFFICLITVDRYLVVKYPFGQVRLSRSNIIGISLCIWLTSITIAVIPLAVPSYFKGSFYSKSGVCIALPLTTESFDGWEYSFTISVCLNFIMLVIVGVGQYLIVREIVVAARNSLVSTRRRNDFSIAIKLAFVVLSDVCCWVPIGVLGIMALTKFEIHPDTYAWVVVLVLPINSALNPFWYTILAQVSKYLNKRKSNLPTSDKTGSLRR